MGKTRVNDFDGDVCRGEAPGTTGPCPELVAGNAETGHGTVDRLARIETSAIEAVTGSDPGKCGMCGCPLTNLELFEQAPEGCPRIEQHGGAAD